MHFKHLLKTTLFAAGIICSICAFSAFKGKVFIDKNGNGKPDAGEKGMAGILVSDGLNVVKTGSDGSYILNGPVKNNFVFVSTPNGYQCTNFFYRAEGTDGQFDFPLIPYGSAGKKTVSFIQITDTETDKYGKWVDNLKDYVKNEHPYFLMHTGDICYEHGMKFHSEKITTATMGLPVYYSIGNHDLVKGKYGEELFQQLFGPVYYSFDAGNTHFIILPMLGGDYKPAYTKSDVYHWLKNDLALKPKGKPVVVFSHDLLTSSDNFIYGISEQEQINLNNEKLVAWIYGHWHTNLVKKHGNSGIISVGSAPPDKGGIDYSSSIFRVITVNEKGKINIDTRYSYLDKHLVIAAPQTGNVPVSKDGKIDITVNIYHSASPVKSVRFAMENVDKKFKNMKQVSSWTWKASVDPSILKTGSNTIHVVAELEKGDTIQREQTFAYSPIDKSTIKYGDNWTNLLKNAAHQGQTEISGKPQMQLVWTANAGATVYMAAPLIVNGTILIATQDEGNLNNGYLMALNVIDGSVKWRYALKNGIKGAIAASEGKTFGMDINGFVYAVDIATGKLAWEKDLGINSLPSNLEGVITEGKVVYAGAGEGLHALNAADGSVIWKNTSWKRSDASPTNQTLAEGVLIGSSNWRALYANEAATGKLLWSRDNEGLRFRGAALSFYEGKLYAKSNKSIFELDLQTGKNIQSKELPYDMKSTSTPLVTKDLIIFGTSDQGMIALDKQNLEQKWQFIPGEALFYTSPYSNFSSKTIESSPVRIGDCIFFGASDGRLYLLNEKTGEKVWEYVVGAPVLTSAAISGNMLTVVDFGGNVYTFKMQ